VRERLPRVRSVSRRGFLALAGGAAVSAASLPARVPHPRAMRGAFIIMATPFTEARAVDFEDLAREVRFLEECGVQGLVWPQLVSEYRELSREERLEGMRVIAQTSRRTCAVILGVQGDSTEEALAYARHAEALEPDGMIALPPREGRSLGDFDAYFRALGRVTERPFFVQTTGGAEGIEPTVEFLVDLARDFPHMAYVKEEHAPVLPRIRRLVASRPPIRAVFSGEAGRHWLQEMRYGTDGTMPGPMFADIYAQIWEHHLAGNREGARDLFAKLLLMLNCMEQIPATRHYIMVKRGVFKTMVSRRRGVELTDGDRDEIDFRFRILEPHLRA
jgi:dihydrodipicolinate synthase/N-acetylneuraminate lyase